MAGPSGKGEIGTPDTLGRPRATWRVEVDPSVPEDFGKDLEEGASREKALRWDEAAAMYERLLRGLGPIDGGDLHGRAIRATLLLRRANALMELQQWAEAREALDDALHDAKASAQEDVIAQALLASGVYAANTGDLARGEAFMMQALERFHRRDDRSSLQGRGWTFLNLASLYGKTGRLDLAFVTFTKAQDVLGGAKNWAGVAAAWEAQAQLRRAIHDEDRWREDLAEAVLFYDREGMTAKADRLRALLGNKRV